MAGVEKQRVRDVMTSRVGAVREADPLGKVVAAFEAHTFQHLPVLDGDGGEVVGIVSDSDLLRVCMAGTYDPHAAVSTVMTRNLIAIEADTSLALAAARMVEKRINSLLVRDAKGRFLGMLTSWDLVKALATEAELEA